MRHAIGIDIGGGSTKIGLVSEDGRIIDRCKVAPDPEGHGDVIAHAIADGVNGLMRQGILVSGIGVGYPGPIHPRNMSGGVGNVAGLNNYPLAQRLTELLGLAMPDCGCRALPGGNGSGGHDRGKGERAPLGADPCRQQAGEAVARLLSAGGWFNRGFGKALGERVDLRGGEGFGFHGVAFQALVMWAEWPRVVTA